MWTTWCSRLKQPLFATSASASTSSLSRFVPSTSTKSTLCNLLFNILTMALSGPLGETALADCGITSEKLDVRPPCATSSLTMSMGGYARPQEIAQPPWSQRFLRSFFLSSVLQLSFAMYLLIRSFACSSSSRRSVSSHRFSLQSNTTLWTVASCHLAEEQATRCRTE